MTIVTTPPNPPKQLSLNLSMALLKPHFVQKSAKVWIGIETEGISNDALGSAINLYRIDDRHVIRITCSLESVVLHDCQFVGLEGPSAIHITKRLTQKLEICCETWDLGWLRPYSCKSLTLIELPQEMKTHHYLRKSLSCVFFSYTLKGAATSETSRWPKSLRILRAYVVFRWHVVCTFPLMTSKSNITGRKDSPT